MDRTKHEYRERRVHRCSGGAGDRRRGRWDRHRDELGLLVRAVSARRPAGDNRSQAPISHAPVTVTNRAVGAGDPPGAPSAPTGLRSWGFSAAREGRCECCHTAYSAGDLVVWDSVGLVLAQHRSVSGRRWPRPATALLRARSPSDGYVPTGYGGNSPLPLPVSLYGGSQDAVILAAGTGHERPGGATHP